MDECIPSHLFDFHAGAEILHRFQFTVFLPLHKLDDEGFHSPAGGAERQSQGGGGLALAVAGIYLDHPPFHQPDLAR